MATEVAALQYRLEASTARFETQIKRAERVMARSAGQMERRASSLDKRLGKLGARLGGALAAVGAAGALRGLDRMLTSLDNIGKTADRVGLTTEALQRLRSAAQQTGVNTRTLDMAMQRFSRRIAEARNGTGEAVKVIEELGISLRNADGTARSSEAVLSDVADAMAGMGSETDQLRVAFKLFDSEGAALVNTLRNGSDALEDMKANARGVIGDDEIRAAEALRNEIDLLKDALGRSFLQAVGTAAEALNRLFGIMSPSQELASAVSELREVQGGIASRAGRDDPRSQRILRALREREAGLIGRIRKLNDTVNAPPSPPSGTGSGSESNKTKGTSRSTADRTAFDDALVEQRASQRNELNRMQIEAIANDEERARKLRALETELVGNRVAEELRAAAIKQNIALGMEAGTVTWEQEEAITDAATAAEQMATQMLALDDAQQKQQESARQTRAAIDEIGNAFQNGIRQADSFGDAIRSVAFELLAIGIRRGVTAGLNNLFPETAAIASKSANGNVFAGGNVVPFARGGIVSRPTLFPMANGTGLMGEAGPEAIMPLRRGAGGKLGVAASGGGTVVQVVNNSGQPSRQERTQGPDGREMVRVIVGEEIGRGNLDGPMKRFGSTPQRVRR